MARVASTCLFLLALCVAAVSGQNPQPPTGTGVIAGKVVDGVSGAPVSGAMVRVAGSGPPVLILTDADGRFLVRGVPKGRYFINVSKPGFIDGANGRRSARGGSSQPIDLADGERVLDLAIQLWQYGGMSGVLVDEAGEPFVGATVKACLKTIQSGHVLIDFQDPRASAMTDDRGVFRHTNLLPGEYVVVVASGSATIPAALQADYNGALRDGRSAAFDKEVSATSAVIPSNSGNRVGDYVVSFGRTSTGDGTAFRRPGPGELPVVNGKLLMYRTTFYPGAATLTQATTVEVKSGEERTGVNFQLRPSTSTSVSGTVTGPNGPQPFLGLRLLPEYGTGAFFAGGLLNAVTLTDAHGGFRFLGVAPGSYTLDAVRQPDVVPQVPGAPPGPLPIPTERSLWIRQPVVVGDDGVNNLNVTLRPGLKISGTVVFQGSAAKPAANLWPGRVRLDLVPDNGITENVMGILGQNSPILVQVNPDETFASYSVPPGRYVLTDLFLPAGWFLKSAMQGGRDLSAAGFDLNDRDLDGIVITLTDAPTRLGGTVTTPSSAPDSTALVLLFPSDQSAWLGGGTRPRRVQAARSNRRGIYAFENIPPGEYLVVAIPDEKAATWRDPKFLSTLAAAATRVSISDGAGARVDLQTRVK